MELIKSLQDAKHVLCDILLILNQLLF